MTNELRTAGLADASGNLVPDPAYRNLWGLGSFGADPVVSVGPWLRVVDAVSPLYQRLPWYGAEYRGVQPGHPVLRKRVSRDLLVTLGVVGTVGTVVYVRRRRRRLASTAAAVAMADLSSWRRYGRGRRRRHRR